MRMTLLAAACLATLCASASVAADPSSPAAATTPPSTAKPAAKTKKASAAKATDATPAATASEAAGETTAPAAGKAPPAGSSPMAELKKSNAALDKVLQKNRPNWSPEAELQRAEVRKVVGSFLDYGELARRALARHWETLTPKQRDEFVETLRELVERSYLKQVHGDAELQHQVRKGREDREARRPSPPR